MMLQVSGVAKRFNAHAAVDDFHLEIAEGETVCMLGPSGSGKTTLLRMVAGLERVDAGTIRIGGTVVDAASGPFVPPQDRRLGMVFQDYALWPHLSALDNVALPLRARHPADATWRAQRMLERVGLAGLEARRPHELSGGQQQRVALARALAVSPALLLCDEPLSNLDAALRDDLRRLIAEVVKETGTSVLYITHDQREALALADRIAIMKDGRMLQIDTPEKLVARPDCEHVARMTHAIGPWPATLSRAQVLETPWGDAQAPAYAANDAAGRFQLYLRQSALSLQPAGPCALRAQARVLSRLTLPDGIELHCEMDGVRFNLRSDTPVGGQDAIALHIDPRQFLLYPLTSTSPNLESLA